MKKKLFKITIKKLTFVIFEVTFFFIRWYDFTNFPIFAETSVKPVTTFSTEPRRPLLGSAVSFPIADKKPPVCTIGWYSHLLVYFSGWIQFKIEMVGTSK